MNANTFAATRLKNRQAFTSVECQRNMTNSNGEALMSLSVKLVSSYGAPGSTYTTKSDGILPRIRTSPWHPIGSGPCRSTQATRDLAQHRLRLN